MQDFRLAVRALRASPVVTIVAVLSLALGIGANATIFSLINSVLLRSLPVVDPGRLALVGAQVGTEPRPTYTYATFARIRQHHEIFEGALAYTDCCGTAILNLGNDNYALDRQFVSGDFFTTLGVRPYRGRLLTPADDAPGAPDGAAVVVSHRVWQTRLGGREDAIGASFLINRLPVTIVGVMPPTFVGLEVGRVLDVAMSYRLAARFTATPFDDDTQWHNIMVRLKPGLSVDDATARLRSLQPQLRAGAMPKTPRADFLQDPLTLTAASSGVSALRQRFETPLLVIFVVVVLVLLVACANIGNLLLARGLARRHEFSVRVALGASRARLIRQLVVEGLVLTAIGACLGLAIAPAASRLLVLLLSTTRVPIALDLSLDWRVIAFTIAITSITALLSGTAPAFRASRVAPGEALTARGRSVAGDGQSMIISTLVVAQIVLALVLVVAAGLFLQTFVHLAHVPLGFTRDSVLAVEVSAPTVPASDRAQLFERVAQAAAAAPGVVAAGGSMNPPIIGSVRADLVVSAPGSAPPADAERISQMNTITPGWLSAYGVGIRTGRGFTDRDTLQAPAVMLVNEAFARRFAPRLATGLASGGDIVGTRLTVAMRISSSLDVPMGTKTIVGVVNDSVARSARDGVAPAIYLPLAQWEWPLPVYTFYLGVRTSAGDPASISRVVQAAVRDVNRDLSLRVQPLSQQIDESLASERVLAVLSGCFGALALLLAGLGLYGVMTYAVVRRRAEIAIRLTVGAVPADIVRLVLSRVSLLVGAGIVLGIVISVWASTFISSLMYGLDPRDPATLAAAALVLSLVGAVAALLPAWRASRIDPTHLLRTRE